MSFEIEGTLHKIYESENKSGKFVTREFVLQIASGNYPEFPKFQLVQDRVGLVDQYSEGDNVKVYFDLRGREWQGKYFTNLNCWRVERAGGEQQAVAARVPAPPPHPPPPTSTGSLPPEPPKFDESANDDLPF